jgi:signal transduction histidine kinase/ActR/RegA family two-component response regulator
MPTDDTTKMEEQNPGPVGEALDESVRAELLDSAAWGEVLEQYARTMKLAVALTDAEGRMLGTCHNSQTIWSLVRAERPARADECPFYLMPQEQCTCVPEALQTNRLVITRSRWGFAHVTVPLLLGEHVLGTLIAGQVFDDYPVQLPIERLARESGLSPQKLWQIARKQQPIGRKTLRLYGDLLSTLGKTFLQARYGVVLERSRQAEIARAAEMEGRAKELAEANMRKNEFIAMLAHELRNPLSAISNAIQISQKSKTDEDAQWSKDVVKRQVEHLTHLIDDLLDVSRIAQGKIQLRQEIFDPSTIIHQAVEVVRPLAERKRQTLSISITPSSMRIAGDSTRFEQILLNLLANAAKYSEDDGHILLSAEVEGSELVIKIKDDGVGIAPEKLPEMFELFAQADSSLARSEGGLGIGLTLVRKLTELHGGTVTAASEGPGKGSEFTVRLPTMEELTAEISSPVAVNPSMNGTTPATGTKSRVLVVDDNQDTATGMAKLLEILGHEVVAAYNGPSAIEKARELRPDVVLLDIGLPGMDGYEVARKLREDPCCSDAILIAASGYGQEDDQRRCREAGFNHHLVKPVDYKLLISLFSKPAPSAITANIG